MAAAGAGEEVGAGKPLNLEAVIGFGGTVPNGLVALPDGVHICFPLGATVVVKNLLDNSQSFMAGHTDKITCLALSPDGRRLASGQETNAGFKAAVIVWDVEAVLRNKNTSNTDGEMLHKLILHKGSVQDLAFSSDGAFLATLGGMDDNSVVVWAAETGDAVCGSPAASHQALTVRWLNHSHTLVTAGSYTLRTWEFDYDARKLRPSDCHLGSLRRVIHSVTIDDDDAFMYCGTKSGDLLEVNARNGRFVRASRNRFSQGIRSLAFVPARGGGAAEIILGNGDGSVAVLDQRSLRVARSCQLMGTVTSVSLSSDASLFFAGTTDGNTYRVPVASLEPELRGTAHSSPINAVVFPRGCSELFLTCSKADIRVWNAATRVELLRIRVPNLECLCLALSPDGTSIVSGWDDGKIRAFFPESGKLQYIISDAHAEAVSALAITSDGGRIVSGGKDGRVRVWNVAGSTQVMELSFKEHKRQVNCITLSHDDSECITAGGDGACIMWNLKAGVRSNACFAATDFKCAVYHPDESQLLTCGSDRKISYWDAGDCNAIRIMDGSTQEVRSLSVDPDGLFFVSGGKDERVRLWNYDEGTLVGVGVGHSGTINQVALAPDQSCIVSVGAEGAIMCWESPAALEHDFKADGYVPRADVEDEVDDAAAGIPKSYDDLAA